MTAAFASGVPLLDVRLMSLQNGDVVSWFNQSQIADGICLFDRLAGNIVFTDGSSSVINPRGSGFELFTRRN